MCERFGAKPLVRLGTLATLIYPVLWVLASPHHYHLLLATPAVIGGLFGAAIYTADLTMMYSLTPRDSRSAYMAMLMLATNLGWAIAPTIGGAIAQALKPVVVRVAGLTFTNLHLLMFISIVVALLHVLLVIPRLPEPQAAPTRAVIRHLLRRPLEWLLGPAEGIAPVPEAEVE
jgi:MFS family permease